MNSPAVLPRNVEEARRLLLEHGPMIPSDLEKTLRERGIVLPERQLSQLPKKYPGSFDQDYEGRLRAKPDLDLSSNQHEPEAPVTSSGSSTDSKTGRADSGKVPSSEEPSLADPAVAHIPWPPPINRSQIVVLCLSTTGPDPKTDLIWEIAAVNLGTGKDFHQYVRLPQGMTYPVQIDGPAVDIDEALQLLTKFARGSRNYAGYKLAQFDLEFIKIFQEKTGCKWNAPERVFDLLVLSMLVDPCEAGHSLADICDRYGLEEGRDFERALAKAHAVAAATRALLSRVNPQDPNWAIALSCLAASGDPWPSLFAAHTAEPDVLAALEPVRDPLAHAHSSTRPSHSHTARELYSKVTAKLGLEPRDSQLQMIDAVDGALREGEGLAVESPTGTGKSLGYLIPAIRRAADAPVVVATATKALQRQLYEEAKKLHTIGLLDVPFRQIAGIANYICTREVAIRLMLGVHQPQEWFSLSVAVRALRKSQTGQWDDVSDQAYLASNPPYRKARSLLTTTPSNCDRWSCKFVDLCPAFDKLSDIGKYPGILCANHALVASWAKQAADRLSDNSSGRSDSDVEPSNVLAPRAMVLIFDEAHNLEETLTSAWSEELTPRSFDRIEARVWGPWGPYSIGRHIENRLSNIQKRSARYPLDGRELQELMAVRTDLAERLGHLENLRVQFAAAQAQLSQAVGEYLANFGGEERSTSLVGAVVKRRNEYLFLRSSSANIRYVCSQLQTVISQLAVTFKSLGSQRRVEVLRFSTLLNYARDRIRGISQDLEDVCRKLRSLEDLPDSHAWVHILAEEVDEEGSSIGWVYRQVPVSVARRFKDYIISQAHSVILTSATLTVADSFDFLNTLLGIEIAEGAGHAPPLTEARFRGIRLSSPFNYDEQSAVILTSHLPVPLPTNEQQFCEELAADQVGFLSLTGGKELALFASRSRMQKVVDLVRRHEGDLAQRGVRLLVQGEVGKAELARRFKREPGTVLFGLRSYWEGFDAPGETLSYLMIEKPPYPHPADPIVAARTRAIAEAGGDPFHDYLVPKTAILMAQGFGRLIRSRQDRGAALISDRRLQLPTVANQMILRTLPSGNITYAGDRTEAWVKAISFVTGKAPDLNAAIIPLEDPVSLFLHRLRVSDEPLDMKLQRAAEKLFSIPELTEEQLKLMRALFEGRDALGVLPTGYGKSICFQLPALLRPDGEATVVVSPLIALIKDQVDELRNRRGLKEVQGIIAGVSSIIRNEILRDLADGKLRLIYVSPERLYRDSLLVQALSKQRLAGLVVDEAHCVSSWGYDFRPEYRAIDKAVRSFRNFPKLGLTATATKAVQDDIIQTLALKDPLVIKVPVNRPNLRFSVQKVGDDRHRMRELFRFVLSRNGTPGIIYASRRETTEEVAWYLRQVDVSARAFHAGMPPEQRHAIQEEFLSGNTQVIVATKAFGMGVNKPDIAWVLHYDLPESLEGYVQEAGRAGRDRSLVAECVLFYADSDIYRRQTLLKKQSLTEKVNQAKRVFQELWRYQRRGSHHIVDPFEIGKKLDLDEDELNVVIAWLERSGMIERESDVPLRGMVSIGPKEPQDKEECKLFKDLCQKLNLRMGKRTRVDFSNSKTQTGFEPERLIDKLHDWVLDRLVTFHVTRRGWPIKLRKEKFDEDAFRSELYKWQDWQRRALQEMVAYAKASACRRALIARHFGDPETACTSFSGQQLCDICSGEEPSWHIFHSSSVPDPDEVVSVKETLLKAVSWASRSDQHRYSEANLKAALLGEDALPSGRPLKGGILNCPQFGALRYLRHKERRYDQARRELLEGDYIRVEENEYKGNYYTSLVITEAGKRVLELGWQGTTRK